MNMKILSHRGYWKEPSEKNTVKAFKHSAYLKFGTETDLRDFDGEIVIAHDMASKLDIRLVEFLEIFKGSDLPLALNIKSDGLSSKLKTILEEYQISNYFVFDMSLPDQVSYIKNGMKVLTGLSDLNLIPPMIEDSNGVWLDSFKGDWFGPDMINQLLLKKKLVCIVSPDLHKRDHKWQWRMIKDNGLHHRNGLLICTDMPEEARDYFFGDEK